VRLNKIYFSNVWNSGPLYFVYPEGAASDLHSRVFKNYSVLVLSDIYRIYVCECECV